MGSIVFFDDHMLVIVEAELWSMGVYYIVSSTYECSNNKKLKNKHSFINIELSTWQILPITNAMHNLYIASERVKY